jgi:hypothetical protein
MRRLLMAIMYPSREEYDIAIAVLKDDFGEVAKEGPEYDFNFTKYYENEFGSRLKKRIVVFGKIIEKNGLVDIRERTGEIEEELGKDGKRIVNIDPGYISKDELVLATKKAKSFKEDLGRGIFAHTVLEFKDEEIITFFHTFADYKIEENKKFFTEILDCL